MLRALVALAAVGFLVAADDAREAAKTELDRMQGTWRLESGEFNGQSLPADVVKTITRTFTGDKVVSKRGDMKVLEGTCTLDPTKKPHTIDVTGTGAQGEKLAIKGIYELDGDTMKTCLGPSGGDRPTEFTAKEGSRNGLFVWKRAKKGSE